MQRQRAPEEPTCSTVVSQRTESQNDAPTLPKPEEVKFAPSVSNVVEDFDVGLAFELPMIATSDLNLSEEVTENPTTHPVENLVVLNTDSGCTSNVKGTQCFTSTNVYYCCQTIL